MTPSNPRCLDHDGTVWSHHPPVGKIRAVPGIDVSAAGIAHYDLGRDRIALPDPERFASRQAYYRTAIHQVGHWTGHPSRLNRPTLADGLAGGLGSREYAREEPGGQIHSYLTGCRLGMSHDPSRHAGFAAEWAKALREDPREIYQAAYGAERISRYVTARMPEMEPARRETSPGRDAGPALPVPEREADRGR